MYRTTASRLRSLKGRVGNSSETGIATNPSFTGNFFTWLTGERTRDLPRIDIPLPGINLPPVLPDYVEPRETKITTLPNGVRIASEAAPDPIASVGMYIDCGSVYENNGTNGASHLLERMAFKSTANKSHFRIVREIEAIGGDLSVSFSREQMTYNYYALKTHVPEMVQLLVDQVRNPAFFDWELDEELQKLKSEIEERCNDPKKLLLEAIHSAGYRGALEKPLFVQDYSTKALRLHLESFVLENYTAPRMVLAAYGVDHEELVSIAEPLLSDLPSVPCREEPKSIYVGGQYRCKTNGGPTHFALAFEVPGGFRQDKQATLQTVLQVLMGGSSSFSTRDHPGKTKHSRLHLHVLNQYDQIHHFSAFNSIFYNSGLFGIYACTSSDFVSKAIDIAVRELILIATPGQVTLTELSRAKESTKSELLMDLESRIIKCEDIGRQILTYGERKPIEFFLQAIDEITLEDITNISQKIISSPLTTGVLGDVASFPSYEFISCKLNAR